MDGGDGKMSNLELENLQLIDISSEDDFLVASFSGDAFEDLRFSVDGTVNWENGNKKDGIKLFETRSHTELANEVGVIGQIDQEPSVSESMEPERSSVSGLRRSLAWDSIFFTSPGVLDPEELSSLTGGFKKDETHLLPGILEDLHRVIKPNIMLDCDAFSLESLEVDLLEDIRASIQNSSEALDLFENIRASIHKYSGAFRVASFGLESELVGMQNVNSSKKLNVTSPNRMSKSASRRQGVNMRGSGRSNKEVSAHPPAAQNNSISAGLQSLKPLKIPDQTKPMLKAQTKKASSTTNHVQMDNKAAGAASERCLMVSKKPNIEDSCSTFLGSTSSSESSSFASTTTTDSTVSRSTRNKCGSASPVESSSRVRRRKTDSRNDKIAVSDTKLKIPVRYSTTNKRELGNSNLSTNLLAMSTLSSCTSPASSLDGGSSESSLSVSTVAKTCTNSKVRVNDTASGGEYPGSKSKELHCQSYVRQENQETPFPNQTARKATTGTSPAARDNTKDFKHSGLRKPSPKIGFFDQEKFMASALNGRLQSGVQSALPKIKTGIKNLIGAAKTRPGKLKPSTSRTLPEIQNMMLDSQKTGATHSAVPEMYGIRRNCTEFIDPTSAVQTKSISMDRERCLTTRRTSTGGCEEAEPVLEPSMQLEEKRAQGILKNKSGMGSKRWAGLRANKISTIKDETSFLGNNIKPFETDHGNVSQQCLENDRHLLKREGKDNVHDFDDEFSCLSRQVEAINFHVDAVTELKGKKAHCPSQFGTKGTGNCSPSICPSLSHKQLLDQKQDSPKNLSKFSLHSFASSVERIPSTRTPLADKDSFCNIREGKENLQYM
ncbi:uncharacterized protein LOC131166514 [Malania oleifera]|uniref:uncharacterized protein LOC131166514 n=1 Tax=Malania oleifera TaxID=397392 RepID=UPI0025ADC58D|nr:uncharacterized protein LOC131166514 [Malania oleifera]